MKKYISILILLLSVFIYAQDPSNRFSDTKNEDPAPNVYAEPNTDIASKPDVASGTGPPGGDDLPIDDYVPLLVFTAVGIIIYTHKKRKLLTQK